MTDIAEAAEWLDRLAQKISPPLDVPSHGGQQQVDQPRSAAQAPLTAVDYVGRLSSEERAELVRLIEKMSG
jgi:hypothetical protein